MTKTRPLRHDVSYEFEGKTYHAQYFIEGGLVTVTSMDYGIKSASMKVYPEGRAKELLRELLMDAKRQGRI